MPVKPLKSEPLKVILYWHMHQPEYRDLRSGEFHQPWTYLHGIKDYVDMAAHLEAIPEARAVVNFVPILLEQIDDYAQQIKGFLNNSLALSDSLLAALAGPVLPSSQEARLELIRHCLRANAERLIDPFPAYRKLADIAHWLPKHPEMMLYVNEQYLVDLLVWYHLAWMGETVRRGDQRIKRLLKKESGYTLHDRRELLAIMGELLGGITARYAALAKRGQVELSMTPYAHPIMPLLLDIQSASEAMPDVSLPFLQHYPGGEERVQWHLQKGLETFEKHFGVRPAGCWPSEGSVSEATLKLLSEAGFKWTASGETVLRNSFEASGMTVGQSCIHQCYQLQAHAVNCFFRDDGLSDLIGFTYSDWHADDAVANFVHHLENIADACDDHDDSVVSIILDGENAWEFYPGNGYYFLRALYKGIAENPRLKLTTYSDCLENAEPAFIPKLVAGSWVYGTFSTWIGDKDKNRAWDMLGDAKRCFDNVVASGRLDEPHRQRAERQLAICEGSDWFWWFGDYNSAESVSDFEFLYRMHLSNLYQILGEEPPAYLSEVFAHGSGDPAVGGTMRKGQV